MVSPGGAAPSGGWGEAVRAWRPGRSRARASFGAACALGSQPLSQHGPPLPSLRVRLPCHLSLCLLGRVLAISRDHLPILRSWPSSQLQSPFAY